MGKKCILIVGGAGFIGSHINQLLNEVGYDTVIFDNLSRSGRQPQECGQFCLGDTSSRQDLTRAFTDYTIDAVMHFAADIDVGASVTNPTACYQNNVANTLKLLETMLLFEVKTLVFSSTAAVYGMPVQDKIREDHPLAPINPYGHSKRMVEQILADTLRSHGLRYSSLRYFNAAGGDAKGVVKFRQRYPSNLVPLTLRAIRNKSKLIINGDDYATPDGSCIRDYIHVSDLAEAHKLAMEQLFAGAESTIYNLGNGNGFSVKEVIRAAEEVTGEQVQAEVGPRRPGDPPTLVADASLAARELGWRPQFADIQSIVAHAWQAM